ncbi:hypothetical protein ACFOYU_15925 [Microvirga sp. GCM10011540]|uniref:hypothetical protein n=1 Tax=Microvirga sp. GCM10011540 TaxID=3317338 RepID=UPI003610D123
MTTTSSLHFESRPHDNRLWEVVACGKVGGSRGTVIVVGCEVLLADAGWRRRDPADEPDTLLVRVGVGSALGLLPGTLWCNGRQIPRARERDPLRAEIVAQSYHSQFTIGRLLPRPVASKAAGMKPAHPIKRLSEMYIFSLRLTGGQQAIVPVFEVLRATFGSWSRWIRHLIEGHWQDERAYRRLIEIANPTHAVADGKLYVHAHRYLDTRDLPSPAQQHDG